MIRVHFNPNSECKFESGFSWYISISIYGHILIYQFKLQQFAESLKNPNLKSLNTLTLYYPFALGSDFIYGEKSISSSLLSLPHLSSVIIIAHNIKSLDGFMSLGRKLIALKDKGWYERQKW